MDQDVFILSGEFGLPRGEQRPVRVFRTEREDRAAGVSPSLEHLLYSAGERAILNAGLDPDFLRPRITHLLATTMPEVKLEEMNLGLLSTRLKSSLQLPANCQARFEVGSSDAGASTFATAWQLLKSSPEPRTTLVLAGQVMPGGSEAIRAISKVLDPAERRLGLNMLAVGDLYMDLFARGWGLDECAVQLEAGEEPEEREAALHRLVDYLTQAKLDLAQEYLCANRSGPTDFGPWSTRWFRVGHIAPATSGGAAVLLSNDPELARAWAEARGGRCRLVRVLGVGEGEQETAVGRRPHPLSFVKSVRQALSALGRDAGVNLDCLRSSAFALLHDAFLSIETAFLFALGMSPLEAVQKQLSFWPNPYGGLTTFGHAIGASGLVQIVKAYHIFTHEREVFQVGEGALHPRFDQVEGPVRALATSVGGPLSHIVAALLESIPVEQDEETGRFRLPARFQPAPRHRFNPAVDGDLPQKAAWVEELFRLYQQRLGNGHGLGLLEAQTSLDLRMLALPLPGAFLEQWRIPSVQTDSGPVCLSDEARAQLKALLSVARPPEDGTGGAGKAEGGGKADGGIPAVLEHAAAAHLGRAPGSAPDAKVKALRDNLFAAIRPPIGLVVAPDHQTGGVIRRLALLSEGVAGASPGSVVRLASGEPYMLATGLEPSLPGLVPLWDQSPASGEGPFAPIALDQAQVEPVVEQLMEGTPGRAVWREVRALASEVVRQALEHAAMTPPPAAVRLLRALVLLPDPMPERVVEYLLALCGEAPAQTPGRDVRVAYCVIDLVGSRPLTGDQLAHDLGVVARTIRRSEGWLSFSPLNLEQSGDRFFATCLIPPRIPEESVWVAMTRFARDVYQEALARDIRLRAGVSVGLGQRFAGIDGGFNATGVVVRAVQTVMKQAPEARRGYWSRGRDLEPDDGDAELLGDGVFLAGAASSVDQATFDRIWSAVGGEVLEHVGGQALDLPEEGEAYCYQYRARRTGDETGPMARPIPLPITVFAPASDTEALSRGQEHPEASPM